MQRENVIRPVPDTYSHLGPSARSNTANMDTGWAPEETESSEARKAKGILGLVQLGGKQAPLCASLLVHNGLHILLTYHKGHLFMSTDPVANEAGT